MGPTQLSYEEKADSSGDALADSSDDLSDDLSADNYPHGLHLIALVVSVCTSIFLIALDQVREGCLHRHI